MKEVVVVSGKGGTGKTSLVASLAALAKPAVLADCDVDAADLHLVLEPRVLSRNDFVGGSKAEVNSSLCTACGRCEALCRFGAIDFCGPGNARLGKTYRVDRLACEGCGVCSDHCAEGAIEFVSSLAGEWFLSETRCGPMVHARLGVAAENSGKLVTQIRQAAKQVAVAQRLELILCDGSPGIGCPVIASLTGASLALFVTEPTPSSLHDFHRIAQLAMRLAIPGAIVVNKADLYPEMAGQLLEAAHSYAVKSLGNVPYDPDVTRAQIAGRSVVEISSGAAAAAIRGVWHGIQRMLCDCTPSAGVRLVQLSASTSDGRRTKSGMA